MRPFEERDAEGLFLLDSNPDVMKYVGGVVSTKIEQSQQMIEFIQKQYKENGVGRLAVIEKSTNTLIGWSGLKYLTSEINGMKNVYELGYRFLPEYWGKGYATETARAALNYAFNEIKTDVVYAMAVTENTGSNRVLQKLGFEELGTFLDDSDLCYWYRLKKENYKQN
ncbi:GNAT family N-acetyltransferase [Elizabethkingia anophelis]|uniref:GNAT family N-acetyltransferase n=1 Tax=Elizabethkingia anophelis TaxID=1117645 RepID=UPI00063A9F3B|nr:GNAT family N-acetyltransferase [Elizabethkingia anophelis]AKH93824.1 GNAT family acetyltransferase [Elizabethkingia anophelis FMS-007]MCL1032524.1 GNAT family N-acetyltransferase [Elizabethkingia anophelis]MCT3698180.1 GNAT family N-acetyltransferase [Elizabethkingia anophelis]MCT3733504.1 GNAT family N-acetyltransferase [Elizabethkingia anophelis]MCT3805938.1 GNAT family N-acetyltransferase [Elizabethkingia anophelis]